MDVLLIKSNPKHANFYYYDFIIDNVSLENLVGRVNEDHFVKFICGVLANPI
jgi:hypothetical protein